jgi:hypothetical protein
MMSTEKRQPENDVGEAGRRKRTENHPGDDAAKRQSQGVDELDEKSLEDVMRRSPL